MNRGERLVRSLHIVSDQIFLYTYNLEKLCQIVWEIVRVEQLLHCILKPLTDR